MATVVMSSGGGYLFHLFSPFIAGSVESSGINSISVNQARTLARVTSTNNYVVEYEGTGLTYTQSGKIFTPNGGEYVTARLYEGVTLIATLTNLASDKFRLINTEQAIDAYLDDNNRITDSFGDDEIDGGNRADQITISTGNDSVDGEAGNDRIIFAASDVAVAAPTARQLVINGNVGLDTIVIGNEFGANSVVSLTDSNVRSIEAIALRDGANLLVKSTSIDTGRLSENLTLSATEGRLSIAQGAGDVVDASRFVIVGTPRLEIIGTAGPDRQTGNGRTSDVLTGEAGSDRLHGLNGKDTLIGGAGRDWLDGGLGADNLIGGAGNDTYVVNYRFDRVSEGVGGGGIDTVLTSITRTLGAGIDHGRATGGFAVAITGNELNNILAGNAARNTLSGQAGADRLIGGLGNDVLRGGADSDVFVFARGHDQDRIVDFVAVGAGDRLDLSNVASITNFADLKARHMTRDGANVVINAGGGDVVTLINVKLADLGAADFIF
jgi:Ca2+-binding RTX toxin-like protein